MVDTPPSYSESIHIGAYRFALAYLYSFAACVVLMLVLFLEGWYTLRAVAMTIRKFASECGSRGAAFWEEGGCGFFSLCFLSHSFGTNISVDLSFFRKNIYQAMAWCRRESILSVCVCVEYEGKRKGEVR